MTKKGGILDIFEGEFLICLHTYIIKNEDEQILTKMNHFGFVANYRGNFFHTSVLHRTVYHEMKNFESDNNRTLSGCELKQFSLAFFILCGLSCTNVSIMLKSDQWYEKFLR